MNGPPLAEPAQEVPSPAAGEVELRVCMAAGCLAIGGQHVRQALAAAAQAQGAAQHGGASTRVRGSGCLGLCSRGPLVLRRPDGVVYAEVTPEQAPAIVAESGPAPSVPAADRAASPVRLPPDLPFFARQQRIVLEHLGAVDPEHIEEYLAAGGYAALAKALHDLSPAQVIDEVTQSGLRGRGGAGYPTGVKWNLVAKTGSGQKYVVCNGDEGDPGAFVDRSVIEGDPHRILEGMAIAGYAVGATQGYLYVRGEYPLAIERLQQAIRQVEQRGVLGARVLDTPFAFRIDLRIGAGAYVCGEETALLASIAGGRGIPRPRPPYPGQSGLWGRPTLLQGPVPLTSWGPGEGLVLAATLLWAGEAVLARRTLRVVPPLTAATLLAFLLVSGRMSALISLTPGGGG